EPRDEIEAMLAAQMAAVHSATMTFTRRLAHVENIPQQDSAARAFNTLARTFTAQMEALKRYRTGGEQKVTVQHVTVNEGGQAVVGNVSHRPGGLSRGLRGSCRKENTPAEQVEAGATVHLPLDQLEPSDLPLGLAAAPRRRERRPDRGTVLLQPRRKRLESADPTRSGIGQPGGHRHARRLRADLRIDHTPAHEGCPPA